MLWTKIALILFPLMFLINVHQNRTFLATKRQIAVIRRQQEQVIIENKRLIAEIAILNSPRRIDALSSNNQTLQVIEPERVLRILTPEEKVNP